MELTYSFLKMCFSVNSDSTNIAGFFTVVVVVLPWRQFTISFWTIIMSSLMSFS